MKTTENTVVDYSFTLLEEIGIIVFKTVAVCFTLWFVLHVMAYASVYAIYEHKDAICYSGY